MLIDYRHRVANHLFSTRVTVHRLRELRQVKAKLVKQALAEIAAADTGSPPRGVVDITGR